MELKGLHDATSSNPHPNLQRATRTRITRHRTWSFRKTASRPWALRTFLLLEGFKYLDVYCAGICRADNTAICTIHTQTSAAALLLSSLELSDTQVYEPQTPRAKCRGRLEPGQRVTAPGLFERPPPGYGLRTPLWGNRARRGCTHPLLCLL